MFVISLWSGLVTILIFFLSLITWGHTFSGWVYSRLLGHVGMFLLGIKVKILGRENLPKEPTVLLINHQSNLDVFFMGKVYPRHTVVIAKRELLKVPLFGVILLATKNILVDREDGSSGKKVLTDAANAIKKDNHHIWIFPEGTRSKGKGLGDFKKGAFAMAIAGQAPIVCIVNQPIEHLLDPQNKTIKSGTHFIKILPPIPTKGLKFRDIDMLSEKVWNLFQKELASFQE